MPQQLLQMQIVLTLTTVQFPWTLTAAPLLILSTGLMAFTTETGSTLPSETILWRSPIPIRAPLFQSATISQPAVLAIASIVTPVNCFGDSSAAINLSVTGGIAPYSFSWSGGITAQNRANLFSGNYPVTVTDANTCSIANSILVRQPSALLSVVANVMNVSCFSGNNGAINVSASGGTPPYSFIWDGNDTVQNRSYLSTGTYNLTVADANWCSITNASLVSQPTAAVNISASISAVSCYSGNNGSIVLNVSGGTSPYSFDWGGGNHHAEQSKPGCRNLQRCRNRYKFVFCHDDCNYISTIKCVKC